MNEEGIQAFNEFNENKSCIEIVYGQGAIAEGARV